MNAVDVKLSWFPHGHYLHYRPIEAHKRRLASWLAVAADMVIAPGNRALVSPPPPPTAFDRRCRRAPERQVRPRQGLAAKNGITV